MIRERTHAQRGQAALELAVLTAALVGALLGMQVYMKRGISGSLRDAADQLGSQYAPRQTTSNFTTTETGTTISSSSLEHRTGSDGKPFDVTVSRTILDAADPEVSERTGDETVGPLQPSIWD